MIIRELIKELLEYNLDAEISRDDSETIELSYISEGGRDKSNTEMVFIEMADFEDIYCD